MRSFCALRMPPAHLERYAKHSAKPESPAPLRLNIFFVVPYTSDLADPAHDAGLLAIFAPCMLAESAQAAAPETEVAVISFCLMLCFLSVPARNINMFIHHTCE